MTAVAEEKIVRPARKRAVAKTPVPPVHLIPLPNPDEVPTIFAVLARIEELSGRPEPLLPGKEPKKIVELPPEIQISIDELVAARETAKYAKEVKEKAEAVIREYLGDAAVGTIGGIPVVELIDSHSSHCDMEVLRASFPEAYDASHKETPYNWVRPVGRRRRKSR